MSNWTPKEIDKLFQDGSKKHEFEYNEAAWGKMEVLLDDRDRRRKYLLWWLIGGLLSVLLVGGVYLFSTTNSKKQISKATVIPKIEQTEQFPTSEIDEIFPPKEPIINIYDAMAAPELAKALEEQPIQKENASFDNTAAKITQTIEEHTSSATNKESQTATTIVNPKTVLPTSIAKHLATEVTILGQEGTILPVDSRLPEISQNLEKESTSILVSKNRAANFMLNALPTLPSTIDFANEPILLDTAFLKKKELVTNSLKKASGNHFVIGLLLARELSFVDIGLCDPNWKTGLSVAYRFGRKHSIRIEGSYIQKEYAASGTRYIAPQGFWEDGIIPQVAIGTCNIIETVITESYFFKGHSARGFYINAGLSSYFMLRERYNYNYDPNNQNLRSSWGTRNENRHWFGIGEVSLGYNLPFSNNSSLQIAPYAQIPLTGLGHGQIKFFTSGVQLRYSFHLK